MFAEMQKYAYPLIYAQIERESATNLLPAGTNWN